MDYYHVFIPGLTQGYIRQKGAYGKTLADDGLSETNDPFQEYLREMVRREHFPSKPSRLNSSFDVATLNRTHTLK